MDFASHTLTAAMRLCRVQGLSFATFFWDIGSAFDVLDRDLTLHDSDSVAKIVFGPGRLMALLKDSYNGAWASAQGVETSPSRRRGLGPGTPGPIICSESWFWTCLGPLTLK